MKTSPEVLRESLDFAVAIAEEAGARTLEWFGGGALRAEVERKADASPVTIADREAERLLRARISERFPEDAILGEEMGEERSAAPRRWILDPIDGTISFVHGVPLFGVMVALEVEGDVVLGVLHFPALGETVAAARGLGCTWNGKPARAAAPDRLEEALVVTTGGPARGNGTEVRARVEGLDRLREVAGIFRSWGDCYGYALVATGRAAAMVDPEIEVWDAAAVRIIVEEAGAVFTDWGGRPSHTSGHALAATPALAGEVRSLLTTRPVGQNPEGEARAPARTDLLERLDFDNGEGLLPVVAQHADTGEVLMLAYANREAVERSVATGDLWFWSRSRGRLWRKGESSGNVLRVLHLAPDCDGDALLAHVLPAGPACHTGARSCFSAPPTLPALSDRLHDRVDDGPAGTGYTTRLLADRNLRLKKIGEEAAELVVACGDGDAERATSEAADLLYHTLVACLAEGVDAEAVMGELGRRFRAG